MKRILISIVCSIASWNVLYSQNVTGKILDKEKQAIIYANVLLQTTDSTFITGIACNEKGEFKIQKVSAGDYRLVISSVGYRTMYVDLQGFERSVNLGTLVLKDIPQQLGEVTVTASNMISTADKKMIFPNQKQIKASANGMDLLRNLMLPRLNINPIDNSVGTTDGGSVQLCINGRKVSKEEIMALQPSDISKVEMLEDPGLRYGNASVAVNYVVKHYDIGGSFGYNGVQSVKSWYGQHNVNGKLSFGKSEISIRYGNFLQYSDELWYNRSENFNFADGRQYHRKQCTQTDGQKQLFQTGALSYNLQDGNKYMLNISARLSHNLNPGMRYYGKLYTEEYPDLVTNRKEASHNRNLSPSLDFYFQRNLKSNQFLAFNAVGTYINTNNHNSYAEYLNDEAIVDYISGVGGKKYSLITEGIYEKGFVNGGQLGMGIKHTQSYTDNEYSGTLYYKTKMKQANTYGYAQYRGKWKNLRYGMGLGLTRSWFRQKGEEDYETWALNPRFNLNYTINSEWSTSLEGNISTANPSLSQLSAADQLTDSLNINRGNPDLKPGDNYNIKFRLNYNKSKWNIGLFCNYYMYDEAIMPHIYREKDKFIHSYANHPDFQWLSSGIDVRLGMLWNILTLSGGIYTKQYWSNGIDFRHSHHSIGWQFGATFMYRNFTGMFLYKNDMDNFFGETLNRGEKAQLVQLQYRLKKMNIGLRMFNPFQKDYKRRDANWNKYASYDYEYHVDDIARMVCVTFSWNFSFGRNYKGGSKRMNNSDTENGIIE